MVPKQAVKSDKRQRAETEKYSAEADKSCAELDGTVRPKKSIETGGNPWGKGNCVVVII